RLLHRNEPCRYQNESDQGKSASVVLSPCRDHADPSERQRSDSNSSCAVKIRSVIREVVRQKQVSQRSASQAISSMDRELIEISQSVYRKVFRLKISCRTGRRRVDGTSEQDPVSQVKWTCDQRCSCQRQKAIGERTRQWLLSFLPRATSHDQRHGNQS